MLTRRGFLGQAAPWALLPFIGGCEGDDATRLDESLFQHGVASGDPLADRVVLWTRITPSDGGSAPIIVEWMVALDEALTDVVAAGSSTTDAEVDFTVKVDASGLSPGTTYYYRFRAADEDSPLGRTRTLPVGAVESARLAVVSCSNYPAGFFHAYRLIAERTDLDLVLHLGDYLYEYADSAFGDGAGIGRAPDPAHETLTLEDYRRRHAQYKADADLRALHAMHPVAVVWDDHEVANDAYDGGAENHDPATEGDFQTRKAAALRAYFEWMPIRQSGGEFPPHIYRSLRIGDLADLVLLDTRQLGRQRQPVDACDPADLTNPDRDLLGSEQEAWLLSELNRSLSDGIPWRLIGQQVMLGQVHNPLIGPTCVANPDQWDGYAAARARLLAALASDRIDNVVILTGDIHSSWAIEISDDPFDASVYDPATGAGSCAVEFVTPAVSSPGIPDPAQARLLEQVLAQTHPHVKFAELNRQGYLLLNVSRERVQADFYHVGDVRQRERSEALVASYVSALGTNRVTPV
jgi:alkaline phosphatase D